MRTLFEVFTYNGKTYKDLKNARARKLIEDLVDIIQQEPELEVSILDYKEAVFGIFYDPSTEPHQQLFTTGFSADITNKLSSICSPLLERF